MTSRTKISQYSVFKFLLLAGLPAVLGVSAAGAACAQNQPRTATPQEVREASSRLAAVLQQQPDLLEDPIASATVEKKVFWSGATEGHAPLLLLPTRVRYKGTTNSYCRLVTASADLKELKVVSLPPQANFDDCAGAADTRYVDVNGDGLLDVVQAVRVQSNVAPAQVAVPLVYLSGAAPGAGYCYSDAASRQLRPQDMKSADSVGKALDAARKRLGIARFECAPAS